MALKINNAEKTIDDILADVREKFPKGDFGHVMTKAEVEEILGFEEAETQTTELN